MAYNILKKKRENLEKDRALPTGEGSYVKDDDELKVKAGDRLDRINAAKRADSDAGVSGPFDPQARKRGVAPSMPSPVNPRGVAQPPKPTPPPRDEEPHSGPFDGPGMFPPQDPGGLADYHDRMKDYYKKKAGTDTVPHTTGVPQSDKDELQDDIDMKPRQ